MLDALDGGAHRGGSRRLKRHESTGHGKRSIGCVGGRALVLLQEGVRRVPRPHNVLAAALGHLNHGVAGDQVDAAAFLDGTELERLAAVQFHAVLLQALARLQDDTYDVGVHTPGARRTFQPGGLAAEPVQVGYGEEAVGVGTVTLMGGVPFLPFLVKGFKRLRCA